MTTTGRSEMPGSFVLAAPARRSALLLLCCALSATLAPREVRAQAQPCNAVLAPFFTTAPSGQRFLAEVLALRVTARGSAGFVSFSLIDRFDVERRSLATPTGGTHILLGPRESDGVLVGTFSELFTDRDRPQADRTSLEVTPTGRVALILHTWGDTRSELASVTCYRGASGQAVVKGSATTPSHGTDLWSFLLTRVDPASIPF